MGDDDWAEDLRAAARRLDSLQGRETRPPVECRPGTMGGRPVFRGTRVQIEILFENLAGGLPLGEILDAYPTLDREDCRAALLKACALLGEVARDSQR